MTAPGGAGKSYAELGGREPRAGCRAQRPPPREIALQYQPLINHYITTTQPRMRHRGISSSHRYLSSYLASVSLIGVSHRYLSSVSLPGISHRCLSSVSLIGIYHKHLSSVSLIGSSHPYIFIGISYRYLSSVSLIGIHHRYLSLVSLIGIPHRYPSSLSLRN